jgi:uncharacterized UPF0160 family protein
MTTFTIGTHDGIFHADDVLAVATIGMVQPLFEIKRSRDPEVWKQCDVLVDVGAEHDPLRRRFDHHQRGRAGARENGVLYSSFGLVWKHYGERICGAEVAAIVDRELVQPIDALDNGQELYLNGTPAFEGIRGYSFAKAISSLNPNWNEDGFKYIDDTFRNAVVFAGVLLERAIASAKAEHEALSTVRGAITASNGAPIIELGKSLPWGDQVRDEAPHALFVVYPSETGTWMCQAVNAKAGTFESRKLLPEAWAGMRDAEFCKLSGVEDGVFCHPGRFICGAKSRDGAMKLAQLAVG